MKKLALAFVLLLTVASTSNAGTVASATSVTAGTLARELANFLQLNELQYLKIKGFESVKLEAIKTAETSLTGDALAKQLVAIESTFAASVLEILTPAQQKAFVGMKSMLATAQETAVK
ncbi:hypothetical protein GU926_18155 [Nibribacter ruber]|uniref:Uncharacterized protein n=1 Tax=Nibribacter ruber TaxID=2698458 RepID=A0A6P1P4D7_9BACT|nr:hypothetical protein [Nibribacter ruber]QHL89251.1 hypothetical protein GU926_18155 [Nibribacter ruber]